MKASTILKGDSGGVPFRAGIERLFNLIVSFYLIHILYVTLLWTSWGVPVALIACGLLLSIRGFAKRTGTTGDIIT